MAHVRRSDQIVFRASGVAEALAVRANARHSPGQVAKRDLGRYYELLRRACPRFSRAEALAIFDVCNGTLWASQSVPLLWASVSDAEGLGAKWWIDQDALTARLRLLSYAESLAVVDAAERFWSHSPDGVMDGDQTDAALRASGLVGVSEQEA